ncbi:MAG: hypothetical protein MUP64_09545 [Anaerolineae bacterium]|nr:hypothetical protein [Anaerolineae bacterium]
MVTGSLVRDLAGGGLKNGLLQRAASALEEIRRRFFGFTWNEVYDFVEFTADNAPTEMRRTLIQTCNTVLERENSGFRFVGDQIVDITSPSEIASIEEAIKCTSPLSGIQAHIETALRFLADRKTPDFRNSIKESISAVEGICVAVTGDLSATLGKALTVLEKRHNLHSALKRSFEALYGYTSDQEGIRHAMLEETDLSYTDAKYMLIACSAFVNYIVGKSADWGLSLKSVRK